MPRFFVSYRIDDGVHAAAAIADRLARHFGPENIFRDRDSLSLGELYPTRIRRALEQCDKVLAVVGPSWLEIRDSSGRRRLDNPEDWVRMELRTAFERDIPVVPVLLDDTPLPDLRRLPTDIASLSLCTYWQVRHQTFESDVQGLIDGLTGHRHRAQQGPEAQSGHNVQHNVSYDGGRIIANQGGHQVIHWSDGDRNSR